MLKRLNRYNFERLGLEAKPGETEEGEKVRQLMIANMIKANDEAAKLKRALPLKRIADDLEKLPATITCNLGQPNQAPGNQELSQQYHQILILRQLMETLNQLAAALLIPRIKETLEAHNEEWKNRMW